MPCLPSQVHALLTCCRRGETLLAENTYEQLSKEYQGASTILHAKGLRPSPLAPASQPRMLLLTHALTPFRQLLTQPPTWALPQTLPRPPADPQPPTPPSRLSSSMPSHPPPPPPPSSNTHTLPHHSAHPCTYFLFHTFRHTHNVSFYASPSHVIALHHINPHCSQSTASQPDGGDARVPPMSVVYLTRGVPRVRHSTWSCV